MEKRQKSPARAGESWKAVRLPTEWAPQLDQIAQREDRSVSYILRRIIGQALGQIPTDPDPAERRE